MKRLTLTDTGSTNTWLKENAASLESPLCVVAESQTAGRGQRGNTWESEPGKNLTLSMLFRPCMFHPADQFAISEAFALAVSDTLMKACGVETKVKWPNDIYWRDSKICGILIEHAVSASHIIHTIAGAGININQTKFVSDAPNPVSVAMITGREHDFEKILRILEDEAELRISSVLDEPGRDAVHREFMSRMWRADGKPHLFRDVAVDTVYEGIIRDVEKSGHLIVEAVRVPEGNASEVLGNGKMRKYAFKEVEFIL